MDGSSSAPDSERELPNLRALSYRPHVQADAEAAPAIAEAARPGPPTPPAASGGRLRSLWRRTTATRSRRVAAVMGDLVAAGAIVATVAATIVLTSGPRPDVTLHRTAAEADAEVLSIVREGASFLEIDGSTLQSYGSYLGLELWSAQNAFGSPCLLAMQPSTRNLNEVDCAPPPAELFIDVSSWGDEFDRFPGVGIIRFYLRGDRVEAHLHYLRGTD